MQATSNQLQQMIGIVSPTYLGGATALAYNYNNANRMVQVQSNGTTLATYAVNGQGQRVQKVVGAATTRFVYDEQGRLVGEYDGTGKLIQETVWLDDLPIATLRPTGANGTPTPINVYYVHADHLGSPRAVTRPSDNAIMWRWDNVDPFGANAPNENPAGQGAFKNALRFPGQYYDAETGTHYNYFRDYDPSIGRYTESDPIGIEGGLNPFGYAAQKPIIYSDSLGLREVPSIDPPGSGWPVFPRPRENQIYCGSGPSLHIIPDNPLGYPFGACCKLHDECYDNCDGGSQGQCALQFWACMDRTCKRLPPGGASRARCERLAQTYAGAVASEILEGPFKDSRRNCRTCK